MLVSTSVLLILAFFTPFICSAHSLFPSILKTSPYPPSTSAFLPDSYPFLFGILHTGFLPSFSTIPSFFLSSLISLSTLPAHHLCTLVSVLCLSQKAVSASAVHGDETEKENDHHLWQEILKCLVDTKCILYVCVKAEREREWSNVGKELRSMVYRIQREISDNRISNMSQRQRRRREVMFSHCVITTRHNRVQFFHSKT